MRKILFRGKRADNGEWLEGNLVTYPSGTYKIVITTSKQPIFGTLKEVIPETVGQYIGLKDKNDKKIFEGDIVEVPYRRDFGICKYEIPECHYCYDMQGDGDWIEIGEWASEVEVIGNIHDTPELLEAEG